jgi:acyl-CoA reductase-like NAD-dependent aldehyde dehydrogenase
MDERFSTFEIDRLFSSIEIKDRPFIGGSFYYPQNSQDELSKISPVDGRDLPSILECTASDIDLAVVAARSSFDLGPWRRMSFRDRKKILLNLSDLLEAHLWELALLDTFETGRCVRDFVFDSIPKAIECIKWMAEACDKKADIRIPSNEETSAFYIREPLGVVGCITAWNDPLVIAVWKIVPALLMGNSVVIKPSELSSYSTIRLVQLAFEAGVPRGVLNVLTGSGPHTGRLMCLHPKIDCIAFTGSSGVARQIIQYVGSSNLKRMSMECGGKSPFIITSNVGDLESAVSCLAENMFYNQGQICSAPSRAILHSSIYDQAIELLKGEAKKYSPRNPLDLESRVGCMVSSRHRDNAELLIAPYLNGRELFRAPESDNAPESGIYINPTIIMDVSVDSFVWNEELFAPILCCARFDSAACALDKANRGRFGLAAAVWSDKLDEVNFFTRNIQSGIVHINSYGGDDNSVPFGGCKESGFGSDKSMIAFENYSYIKTVWAKHRLID